MERNGQNSCTGISRNIRYFWIKDRVDKGEVEIKYCPTTFMLADNFTKPLQGQLFHLYRDIIMGYKPISILLDEIEHKERVEVQNRNVIQSRQNLTRGNKTKKSYKEALVIGGG